MELYHNQVTRGQGAFSLRSFHRSWGILMIQGNISAPCAVLDFPTREAFARELTTHHYDIVGISSIIVNVGKAREMCRMVRELSPGTTVIVGGHIAAIPGVEQTARCRPHRQRRRHRLDAPIPGRRSGRPHPPPRFLLRLRSPRAGRQNPGRRRHHLRHHHFFRRLSHGLQFLHHHRLLRRQGQNPQFLRDRRAAFPPHGTRGKDAQQAQLLHHGREFPPPEAPRHGTAGPHESRRQELDVQHLLVRQRHRQVHLRRTGRNRHRHHLAGPRIAALQLLPSWMAPIP